MRKMQAKKEENQRFDALLLGWIKGLVWIGLRIQDLYFDEVNSDPVVFHWKYKMDDIDVSEELKVDTLLGAWFSPENSWTLY